MGVEGYDKVYTKVIEGKPKRVYKRPNGTKHYVLGFGKMRTIENYVKLCRKKAVEKAAKSKKVTKKPSTRKRYGGFFEELFTGKVDEDNFTNEKYENGEGFADPPHVTIDMSALKTTNGGNSFNRGGQLQEGGKRKRRNKNKTKKSKKSRKSRKTKRRRTSRQRSLRKY